MNARQFLLNLVVVVVLLAVGGGIAYESYQSNNYVSTDNAQVSVPIVHVAALSAAEVRSVPVSVGQRVQAGQALVDLTAVAAGGATSTAGAAPTTTTPATTTTTRSKRGAAAASGSTSPASAQTSTSASTSPTAIDAPVSGVVSAVDVSTGQTVLPGQAVADIAEPAQATIVANIPETSIRNVAVGQKVDVTIDAYPGTKFSGRVQTIQPATQASLSLFPASALSGSFTKVTQLVPVTVSFDAQGYNVYNGLSAEVSIHTGNGSL